MQRAGALAAAVRSVGGAGACFIAGRSRRVGERSAVVLARCADRCGPTHVPCGPGDARRPAPERRRRPLTNASDLAGWACSCDGYYHTGACTHLGQVERRSEREGWAFGAVAPLHRVGRYLPRALPARGARRRATVHAPGRAVVPFRPATQLPLPPADQHRDKRHAA